MHIKSIVKGTLLAILIAVVGFVAVFLGSLSSGQACSFRYTVAPHVFIETKLTGEQISHHGYQAHLTPLGNTSEECMIANAQSLFDSRLRAMAEKDGKTHVWFTYYLDKIERGDQKLFTTYRVIFVREGEEWRRAGKTETRV